MAVGLIFLSILCAAAAGTASALTGLGNPWLVTIAMGNAIPMLWLTLHALTARETLLPQEATVRDNLELRS